MRREEPHAKTQRRQGRTKKRIYRKDKPCLLWPVSFLVFFASWRLGVRFFSISMCSRGGVALDGHDHGLVLQVGADLQFAAEVARLGWLAVERHRLYQGGR